jgi:hypothetical protein
VDALIEKIKKRGHLGEDLTENDWKLLLADAEEFGSLQGVLAALKKLPSYPVMDALEKLLCTAICTGDAETAIITCRHLGRDLFLREEITLVENITLNGDVEKFIDHFEIHQNELRDMLHTAIVIQVCKFFYKRRTGKFPEIELTTWLEICNREYKTISPYARFVSSRKYPGAILLRLGRHSLVRFAGVLLREGFISRENFRIIIK